VSIGVDWFVEIVGEVGAKGNGSGIECGWKLIRQVRIGWRAGFELSNMNWGVDNFLHVQMSRPEFLST